MIAQFNHIADYLSFVQLQTEKRLDDFVIYSFDEVAGYTDHSLQTYQHNYYEVSLEINQGCSFQIDQYEFGADSKRLTIIAPGRLQRDIASTTSSDKSRGFTMFFSERFINSHLNTKRFYQDYAFLKRSKSPVINLNETQLLQVVQLFEIIKYEYTITNAQHTNTLKSMINVVFDKAAQINNSLTAPILSRAEQIAADFEQLCSLYFQSKHTVQEYAHLLAITPKHLSTSVKQVTGKTALQIILGFKLNHAKALLVQTSFPISQVAYEAGFDHPHYFSTVFKRQVGLSPSEFRKI